MSFVLWKPCYCIGDPKIDAQHQNLVSLLNSLNECIQRVSSKKLIDCTLMELVRYGEEHFRDEEDLMQRIGFPELDRHRKEHEKLLVEVFAFKKRFDRGQATKMELLYFLRDWLIDHIINEDLKIRHYL